VFDRGVELVDHQHPTSDLRSPKPTLLSLSIICHHRIRSTRLADLVCCEELRMSSLSSVHHDRILAQLCFIACAINPGSGSDIERQATGLYNENDRPARPANVHDVLIFNEVGELESGAERGEFLGRVGGLIVSVSMRPHKVSEIPN
jgi:hypothetical protein